MPAQRSTPPNSSNAKPYSRPSKIADWDHNTEDDEILASSSSKPRAQRRLFPAAKTDYIDIDSDDENVPPLSADGSDDHDRSSDFDPALETPSKSGKGFNGALYVFDDEDEDTKPELSDDEISYPGIPEDDHQEESEDEEVYGRKGKGKGKGKAKAKATPKKANGSVGGSGKKPPVGWSSGEDWELFKEVHPKCSRPNWQAIADLVGRDAKNRYATMSKRLEGLVKSMSGK